MERVKLSRGGKKKKNRVEKMKRDSSQARERGEEAVWWERIEGRRQKAGLGVGKGTGGG